MTEKHCPTCTCKPRESYWERLVRLGDEHEEGKHDDKPVRGCHDCFEPPEFPVYYDAQGNEHAEF